MVLSTCLSLLGCHYFACLVWWTLRLEHAPSCAAHIPCIVMLWC